MEAEAARLLWNRSETLGDRYRTLVIDGDAASFNAVTALNDGAGSYQNLTVTKEECVNHVSKRLGSRLRKLKESMKEPTTTKKGKSVQRSVLSAVKGLPDCHR